MRVLMLGKGWFPAELGGLDRYYRNLLERLPEACGVVVGPADEATPRLTAVSEHSEPLLLRIVAFTRAARRAARTVDLVDAHFALYAFLPLCMRDLRQKPLVVHFHGPWADESASAGDTSCWRRIARRRLERSVYSRATLGITLTGAFRRLLVERYGVSPWNTVVVAPGVNLDRFSPSNRSSARARFDLGPGDFVVSCARRLVPRMGVDLLIDAWAREFGSDSTARLLIAGDGELRGELERQIATRSLTGSVDLLGRIDDDELADLYRAADVNVVPSISFEGFGLVVLEAAACGTPSIVTRAGGLPEAIAGLGNDLSVPTADVGALAERLARAKQGELPPRAASRAWAEAHGWQQAANTHRELFEQAVSGRRRSRKMRVVYLDHVARLSGGELALLRLLKVLTDVEPHVILTEEGPLIDRLLQDGISVEVLPMRQRTRELRRDRLHPGRLPLGTLLDTFAYTLRTAWRLRQLRPDVVHTNSLKSGIYGSLAARLAGVPVVWHLRERIVADYLPLLGVLLVRMMTHYLPQVVISNSRATRQTIWPRNRSLVIPSVIEPVYPPGQPAAAATDRSLVVGIVGRVAPWKGQDVFLRAFAHAFPEGPQRAIVVGAPLFGEAEAAYAEGLRHLADELGLAGRVEFRGHRLDIVQELRTIDVLVHASRGEGFGQVVAEGMSVGLPVVASRGGGPEEIITDGVDGVLYPAGDIVALAEILVRLDKDPPLRAQLGRAAVLRVREFAPDAVAEQMMSAYEMTRRAAGSHQR